MEITKSFEAHIDTNVEQIWIWPLPERKGSHLERIPALLPSLIPIHPTSFNGT